MSRKPYTTDLSDAQWQALQGHLPKATDGRTGRPRKHDLREVVNALFYLLHNGCTTAAPGATCPTTIGQVN